MSFFLYLPFSWYFYPQTQSQLQNKHEKLNMKNKEENEIRKMKTVVSKSN